MFAARTAMGNYCYKKSITYILKKCNWLTAEQLINVSVLKTIHSVITTGQPKAIFRKFEFNRRSTANIIIKRFPKCKQGQDFYLNKGLKLYNKLPAELKK